METEFNELTILSGVRQPYNIVLISLSKHLVKNIITSDFLHIAQPWEQVKQGNNCLANKLSFDRLESNLMHFHTYVSHIFAFLQAAYFL